MNILNFFRQLTLPVPVPVPVPVPTPDGNTALKAQPLLINLPASSVERTLRCLWRMVRLHRGIAGALQRGDTPHMASLQEELVRRQAMLTLSGIKGCADEAQLLVKIAELEGK